MTVPAELHVPFSKGHGTENDFVIIDDPDGMFDLTTQHVQYLCDRHAGIGADGVLRITRCSALPDGTAYQQSAEWFMDYRNADGSVAQMCGNGVRVFAEYLRSTGRAGDGVLAVGTRGGLKSATFEPDGTISVDMGPATDLGTSSATVNGTTLTGTAVSMGNPHLVCDLVGSGLDLAALTLHDQPAFDRDFFVEGVNLEFIEVADSAEYDADVSMRVFERGVGETRSCGTGICAVAHSVLAAQGKSTGSVRVTVPGGTLTTVVSPDRIILRGTAHLVASGTVTLPL